MLPLLAGPVLLLLSPPATFQLHRRLKPPVMAAPSFVGQQASLSEQVEELRTQLDLPQGRTVAETVERATQELGLKRLTPLGLKQKVNACFQALGTDGRGKRATASPSIGFGQSWESEYGDGGNAGAVGGTPWRAGYMGVGTPRRGIEASRSGAATGSRPPARSAFDRAQWRKQRARRSTRVVQKRPSPQPLGSAVTARPFQPLGSTVVTTGEQPRTAASPHLQRRAQLRGQQGAQPHAQPRWESQTQRQAPVKAHQAAQRQVRAQSQRQAQNQAPTSDGKVLVNVPGGKVAGDRFTVETAWGWATTEVPVGASAGQPILVQLPRNRHEASSLASTDTLDGPGPTK